MTDDGLTPAWVAGQLAGTPFAADSDLWLQALSHDPARLRHGDAARWLAVLRNLPTPDNPVCALDGDPVTAAFPLARHERDALESALKELSPWRKGPFRIGPIDIDTEWRSDWKWQRIASAMAPLADRRVLDIGGGNGYFGWRCAGRGAAAVLNVDPTLLFYLQFLAINHFLRCRTLAMLPLTFEALPETTAFDTVMSMGVLYHRRAPLDHLQRITRFLRPGGELVLETLVVDGDAHTALVPERRYAGMRNVWFLPSVAMLSLWLSRCGYRNIRVIDQTVTTRDEQRSTSWMPFHSLADALDPSDPGRTREGYPAPKRAVLLANRN